MWVPAGWPSRSKGKGTFGSAKAIRLVTRSLRKPTANWLWTSVPAGRGWRASCALSSRGYRYTTLSVCGCAASARVTSGWPSAARTCCLRMPSATGPMRVHGAGRVAALAEAAKACCNARVQAAASLPAAWACATAMPKASRPNSERDRGVMGISVACRGE